MSSTQANEGYVFDLSKYIPEGVSWLWLVVFVIGVGLGWMVSPKPIENENQDDNIVQFIDTIIAQERFCLGSVCITEDMTWAEMREQYAKFRNHPSANNLIISTYKQMCGGI